MSTRPVADVEATVAVGAQLGDLEVPHEGHVRLHTYGDQQWVEPLKTAEKQFLTSCGWTLGFHNGWGYVHKQGSASKWLSGPDGLLKKSLHKTSSGRFYLKDNETNVVEWFKDVQMQFTTAGLPVHVGGEAHQACMWFLRLPRDGAQVFFSMLDVVKFVYGQDVTKPSLKVSHIHSWLPDILSKLGCPASHFRLGRRSTDLKQKATLAPDVEITRCLPSGGVSMKALMIFFSRTIMKKGDRDVDMFGALDGILKYVLKDANRCFVWTLQSGLEFEIDIDKHYVDLSSLPAASGKMTAAEKAVANKMLEALPSQKAEMAELFYQLALLRKSPARDSFLLALADFCHNFFEADYVNLKKPFVLPTKKSHVPDESKLDAAKHLSTSIPADAQTGRKQWLKWDTGCV